MPIMSVAELQGGTRPPPAQTEMQEATVLITISPVGRPDRAALRAFLRGVREVRKLSGFRRWQTFRALEAVDALVVVLDWESVKSMRQGLGAVRELVDDLRRTYPISDPEPLSLAFDRLLIPEGTIATLVRITHPEGDLDRIAERDSELALKALAAPGTTRVRGARSRSGRVALCRIDFDSEDAIWHFLDSPLRRRWCVDTGPEGWALNLPRLEFANPLTLPGSAAGMREMEGSLSVQLAVSDNGEAATIRMLGRVDPGSAELTERFCVGLVRDGCRHLEVNVSDLTGISSNVLLMLARTARALKDEGGSFTLIDNAERVRKITRTKELQAALA
jgi:anti-anti-sigma factor